MHNYGKYKIVYFSEPECEFKFMQIDMSHIQKNPKTLLFDSLIID